MGTHPIFESDFDCLTKMTLTEKLAGHQAARKVGDMRVTGITGEYPTHVPESEAVSPWESGGAVEEKQTLVIGGAVADQTKDFPTQALKHQQNKPQALRQSNHAKTNPQRNHNIQQPK